MPSSVIVVGVGQIGSRHLQGLARCPRPLQLFVCDPNVESLTRARSRWQEVGGDAAGHTVTFAENLRTAPPQADLAIVATSAGGRAAIIEGVARQVDVRSWILEKVLAQSEDELARMVATLHGNPRVWVNIPRRMMAWHAALRRATPRRSPTRAAVVGGDWGLACNAVHFIDFLAWWTDETLAEVHVDRLEPRWYESKRPGYWEVNGTLVARFSGGSELALTCQATAARAVTTLAGPDGCWELHESDKTATRSDGLALPGRVEYQSEMSGAVAAEIIETGACRLPAFPEAVELHRVFLRSLLAHWNQHNDRQLTHVPIT